MKHYEKTLWGFILFSWLGACAYVFGQASQPVSLKGINSAVSTGPPVPVIATLPPWPTPQPTIFPYPTVQIVEQDTVWQVEYFATPSINVANFTTPTLTTGPITVVSPAAIGLTQSSLITTPLGAKSFRKFVRIDSAAGAAVNVTLLPYSGGVTWGQSGTLYSYGGGASGLRRTYGFGDISNSTSAWGETDLFEGMVPPRNFTFGLNETVGAGASTIIFNLEWYGGEGQ